MKIGFLAQNFGELSVPFATKQSILSKDSGNNVGNWVFWHAANLLIGEVSFRLVPPDSNGMSAKDYADIDVLVIPAANWIQSRSNFSWLASFVEELDKPCLVFGLGAQSNSFSSIPELPVEKGVLAMLQAISKRTPWIGVRGEYTSKVCRYYGIDNIKVMGCSSIFINNNPKLGRYIGNNWNIYADGRMAIHSAANSSVSREPLKLLERYLFNYRIENPGSSYIIQGPQFWKLIFQSEWPEREYVNIRKMVSVFEEGLLPEEFVSHFRKYAYIPYSVNAWINYLQYHSCSVGTRIHGSILSLSAQLPTVCITIDTRTKELCEVLDIPNVSYSDVDLDKPLSALFQEQEFKGAAFDENRQRLLLMYQDLLNELDLNVSKYCENILHG